MQIDIRDNEGQLRFTVHVDPANPPTVVKADDGRGTPVSLNWDRAVDDTGYLRLCPVCGCHELYLRKRFARVTPFVIVLALAALFLWKYGVYTWVAALVSAVVLLFVDVLLTVYNKPFLVCYLCGAVFRNLPIRRGHPKWDAAVAERFAK